jgi:hypothetical protein
MKDMDSKININFEPLGGTHLMLPAQGEVKVAGLHQRAVAAQRGHNVTLTNKYLPNVKGKS